MLTLPPLAILVVGVAVVLGMMIALRLHAFLALISAAFVVSALSPGKIDVLVPRVAEAFGRTVGNIGIVIALAAVIGSCLMESGAADRIVQTMLRLCGVKRAGAALAASGFVLSGPVFFDTVFYLLAPLARSLYRQTQRDYLRYLMAICAGGAVTHTLVPPTPGPLIVADTLGVDVGLMIVVGAIVGVPMTLVGLAFAAWTNRRMPIAMRPLGGAATEPHPPADRPLPGLLAAALPVVLPVVLIASHTVLQRLAKDAPPESLAASCATWAAVFGNANCALAAAATAALLVYVRQCRPTRTQTAKLVEQALESGAVIILITAAGGAFGAMLKEAQLGPAIEGWFGGAAEASGAGLLAAAFALCAVLKFSQGSSTVAMVTSSSMMASLLAPDSLPFHPVYLALAIGSGSLVGSWMNDSGFWIYCKLGGLTEVESLKSWTPMFALMGATGLGVTLALSALFPLRGLVAAAP